MVSMSNIVINDTSKYGLTPTVFNDIRSSRLDYTEVMFEQKNLSLHVPVSSNYCFLKLNAFSVQSSLNLTAIDCAFSSSTRIVRQPSSLSDLFVSPFLVETLRCFS